MSLTISVEKLLRQEVVESSRIEYKKDFNPKTIIHSICAFANDIDNIGGGYIIIGVEEDNGTPKYPITGIPKERIDSTLKKLRELCHYIEPLYEPQVEPIMYDGVYVIVIKAYGGYGRPYKAPIDPASKQSHKRYYIRKFSSSVIASNDEEKQLFYIASDIPFDDRPNLSAGINVLSRAIMRDYLQEINSSLYSLSDNMSTLDIAKSLKLVDGPPEELRPLNVGILMFSDHIEDYFRYARIEVVYIPEPTGTNMIEKVFTGPLQDQLRNALRYIKNTAIASMITKKPQQAEAEQTYNYPYAAIEEILANAVYHRSYQIHEPITVRITNEEIEITSFPGFDRSISDNDIEQYNIRARRYRNRRIGDYLKELHLIEGRNTGFPNALNALIKNGSPKLRFVMPPERDYLSVIIPIHPVFLPKRQGKIGDEAYQGKLMEILANNSGCTLTELAKYMGYKGITNKLRKTIDSLIDSHKVKKEITANNKIALVVDK